jgi:hypothetical protein
MAMPGTQHVPPCGVANPLALHPLLPSDYNLVNVVHDILQQLRAALNVSLSTAICHVFLRQQNFKVTVPQPGTYTFSVQPTQVLAANESLPSSYGNIGSYKMAVTWPQPQSHD